MKKTIKYVSLTLYILIISTPVSAALTYSSSDKVKSLATYGLGNIGVIMVSTVMANPAGCPHTDSYKLYKIVDTTDHGKNMYAMILAAKSTQNSISLLIDNDECAAGYAVIKGIISM